MTTRQRIGRRVLAALLTVGVATSLTSAQPANDECANAIEVFRDVTWTGSTVGASDGDLGSCTTDGNDIWLVYHPVLDETIEISLCESGFDTTLGVWSSCGGQELICDDASCPGAFSSMLEHPALVGTPLYIRVAGFFSQVGPVTLNITEGTQPPEVGNGADVVYTECQSVMHYGSLGTTHGYSLGSYTCNIGTGDLLWGGSANGTPWLAMNAYRLHDGRLVQIGLSNVKHACCAAAGSGCGLSCNGRGGSVLGAGCRDIYSAGWNGGQGSLGPRSGINALTGEGAAFLGGGATPTIGRRLQIDERDMEQAGALYFVEGVYVAQDDALSGNAMNNASYRRVAISSGYDMSVQGPMHQYVPAITAWRDHGLGVDQVDASVELSEVDIPNEGRFHVATKVTDNGNGTWTYDYGIFNLNSDAGADSFTVPIPEGVEVTAIGFHDVDYHSGEVYDNTDWSVTLGDGRVQWRAPETYQANPNSNALRWGTMYNFWFTASTSPSFGDASLRLFKPHSPSVVDVPTSMPSRSCVFCDVDGFNGVELGDLLVYLSRWFDADPAAELTGDDPAMITLFDLLVFLECFFIGCP